MKRKYVVVTSQQPFLREISTHMQINALRILPLMKSFAVLVMDLLKSDKRRFTSLSFLSNTFQTQACKFSKRKMHQYPNSGIIWTEMY